MDVCECVCMYVSVYVSVYASVTNTVRPTRLQIGSGAEVLRDGVHRLTVSGGLLETEKSGWVRE